MAVKRDSKNLKGWVHVFEDRTELNQYYSGEQYKSPCLAMVEGDNKSIWYNKGGIVPPGPVPPHDYSQDYLTFEVISGGTILSEVSGVTLSKDNGESWSNEISGLTSGDKVIAKGNVKSFAGNSNAAFDFGDTVINVYGNIMSIYDSENFRTITTLNEGDCFSYLFLFGTQIISAENLVLPATTLANFCYYSMFKDCTSLTTPPELPATTLAERCYEGMFVNCTSLTTAPELPATTLTYSCYGDMFSKCTSLTTAPELPATTLATDCYENMFYGCTSLTVAPVLSVTTLASGCYSYMFAGCTSLTVAPVLPATTLADECYGNMFNGTNLLPDCSNIDFTSSSVVQSGGLRGLFAGTKVTDSDLFNILPINQQTGKYCLPVTSLTGKCYENMFYGCTSLTTAPELPATTLADYCYSNMFAVCTGLTSAPELPATTLADSCYSSMFFNCTSLTTAPELTATTLAQSCYSAMFQGCSSLTSAPELPATTLANNCYHSMFQGCRSLTTAPVLPATTLADNCYGYMFFACASLTTAPALPATTLTQSCYYYMFYGCGRLNYIKCLATDISANNCTVSWVNNVASSGTFVKNASMSSWGTGVNGIPDGWTVQDA